MSEDIKLHKLEGVKAESAQLRGTIADELLNDSDHFEGDTTQMLKFHGTYQQDNRDRRGAKDEQGNRLGKAYSCMIRTGIPGGRASAEQFLAQLDLCDQYGDGTVRLTTRQAFQLHGVLKGNLKQTIAEINKAQMTSLSACGDVNRNVMCNPTPVKNAVIEKMHEVTHAISDHLKPQTTAYCDIWLTDEEGNRTNVAERLVEEPIYGKTYLPRKFKIGVALPEDNHIDVFTQDLGLLGVVENGELIGFDILVGGGMGTTPSAKKTFPAVGKYMAFLTLDQVVPVCEAVVKVQRDFGNRTDRKVARMKYLIADWGIEKFKAKVEEYYGSPLADPKRELVTDADDYMGWREQGDGKLALGLNILAGRIQDTETTKWKTGLRTLFTQFPKQCALTALQSLIIYDIDPSEKAAIEKLLADHGLPLAEGMSASRRHAIACPALPMCGLAVTESERILDELITIIEEEQTAAGVGDQRITFHMTGCPNGCARPYVPEIGIVGKAKNKYTIFLGGSAEGTRIAFIYQDMVPHEDLRGSLSVVLKAYASDREENETFGDFCYRLGAEKLQALTT